MVGEDDLSGGGEHVEDDLLRGGEDGKEDDKDDKDGKEYFYNDWGVDHVDLDFKIGKNNQHCRST